MNSLILGASENPMRYSNRAQKKLIQFGHSVVLVNPKGGQINGITCFSSIDQVTQAIDTVTLYINPTSLNDELDKILSLKPRRVIFNPGSESGSAAQLFKAQAIEVVEDCTLMMLDGGRY